MNALFLVTVFYNSEGVLKEFFESLEKQTSRDFVLVCVNNASPDNSMALALSLAANVSFKTVFVDQKTNGGIAQGNNAGIRKSLELGADAILLCNNDIVIDSHAIERLRMASVTRRESLVTGKIYFWSTDLIWYGGGHYDLLRMQTCHHRYLKKETAVTNCSGYFDYAPTCFCLITKEVFDKVGFMDESFFVYADDTDFMLRANRAGFKAFYDPEIVVHHKESTSTGGRLSAFSLTYMTRNKLKLVKKHFSVPTKVVALLFHFLIFLPKELLRLGPRRARALFAGTWRGIRE